MDRPTASGEGLEWTVLADGAARIFGRKAGEGAERMAREAAERLARERGKPFVTFAVLQDALMAVPAGKGNP